MLWGVNEPQTNATVKRRTARENCRLNDACTKARELKKAAANLTPAIEVVDLSELAASLGHVPDTREVVLLAAEFARIINEWLTPAEMRAVVAQNEASFLAARAKGKKCQTCATGDYCDSNVAMEEAFTTVLKRDMDLQSEADVDLWGRAWDRAKDMNFDHELLAAYAETF